MPYSKSSTSCDRLPIWIIVICPHHSLPIPTDKPMFRTNLDPQQLSPNQSLIFDYLRDWISDGNTEALHRIARADFKIPWRLVSPETGPYDIAKLERETLVNPLSNFWVELFKLVEIDNVVCALGQWGGRNESPLWGLPPTGREMGQFFIGYFLLQDGKITTEYWLADDLEFLRLATKGRADTPIEWNKLPHRQYSYGGRDTIGKVLPEFDAAIFNGGNIDRRHLTSTAQAMYDHLMRTWAHAKLDRLTNYFQSDVDVVFRPTGPDVNGLDAIRQIISYYRLETFESFFVDLMHVAGSKDYSLTVNQVGGVHRALYWGIEPTERRICQHILGCFGHDDAGMVDYEAFLGDDIEVVRRLHQGNDTFVIDSELLPLRDYRYPGYEAR